MRPSRRSRSAIAFMSSASSLLTGNPSFAALPAPMNGEQVLVMGKPQRSTSGNVATICIHFVFQLPHQSNFGASAHLTN
jgi:hypothetical protein